MAGLEDAVAKHQEVGAGEHRHRHQIHDLGGNSQGRRQQCRGRDRQAVLRSGNRELATGLVMQAWRELILMLPNEQPLEREMEHERDAESDRQRYLKGCPPMTSASSVVVLI